MYNKIYLDAYTAKEAGASSQLIKQLARDPNARRFFGFFGRKPTYNDMRTLISSTRNNADWLANTFNKQSLAPYLEANRAAAIRRNVLANSSKYTTDQLKSVDAQYHSYLLGMHKYKKYQDMQDAYKMMPNNKTYRAYADKALQDYNYQIERANNVRDNIQRYNNLNTHVTVRGQLAPQFSSAPISHNNQLSEHNINYQQAQKVPQFTFGVPGYKPNSSQNPKTT